MSISRRSFVSGLAMSGIIAPLVAEARFDRDDDDFVPHRGDHVDGPVFRHGIASGDPLLDRVILWTRVTPRHAGAVNVHWRMARDAAMKDVVAEGDTWTSHGRDFTVKVDVAGLLADSTYYYQFIAERESSPIGRTRTLPAGHVDQARLAVCSCSNIAFGFFGAYGHIARRDDLNAVVHLGDYLYEYANGTFGDGEVLGRQPFPNREILSLSDYRHRHGQYKADLHLQECHRQHPFICVWDDHEFTNDAWKLGAENHQADEGVWLGRKARALRAYFEWMPIRQTSRRYWRSGNIFRSFRFGDLADLMMLETRVSARSQQLPTLFDLAGNLLVAPEEVPAIIAGISDPARELLGQGQRHWLFDELRASRDAERSWRVLGQQTMMGQLKTPVQVIPNQPPLFLPFSMDQWDGYEAERNRVLDFLTSEAIGDVVICTGDIHSSWAQDVARNPFDVPGAYNPFTGAGSRAVEFVTPGITSPAFTPEQAAVFEPQVLAAPHVNYVNLSQRGYYVLDLNHQRAQADWFHMRDITDPMSEEDLAASFMSVRGTNHAVVALGPAVAAAGRPPAPALDARQRWMMA